ncbi:MAG: RNA polymerase sigma factor [Sphingomonadaceae bacterium]|jgi:RNA polymerase sigma-70 factor (ECF subfamily)|nr:RNA polymerase sigma factor [Sphingomonadaceae bacterium]
MSHESSDAELAIRAVGGEEVAFTAIMRRYKDPLYRLIRRHVGDADESYDVLQESFVSAWGALARYDSARPFYSWLARIALNKCRDRGRRLFVRRLLRGATSLDTIGDLADPQPLADTLVIDRDALARLDRAIASLPVKLKEPLILTALDEMSQAEAAAILGVSIKTVETRIYRARQKLAASLDLAG